MPPAVIDFGDMGIGLADVRLGIGYGIKGDVTSNALLFV